MALAVAAALDETGVMYYVHGRRHEGSYYHLLSASTASTDATGLGRGVQISKLRLESTSHGLGILSYDFYDLTSEVFQSEYENPKTRVFSHSL